MKTAKRLTILVLLVGVLAFGGRVCLAGEIVLPGEITSTA